MIPAICEAASGCGMADVASALTEFMVSGQIILIHDVPVYLIECSTPYVAWDKIAPDYPPK